MQKFNLCALLLRVVNKRGRGEGEGSENQRANEWEKQEGIEDMGRGSERLFALASSHASQFTSGHSTLSERLKPGYCLSRKSGNYARGDIETFGLMWSSKLSLLKLCCVTVLPAAPGERYNRATMCFVLIAKLYKLVLGRFMMKSNINVSELFYYDFRDIYKEEREGGV